MNKPKVVGSFGAGGGVAVLVWVWGLAFPDTSLPPEAAAALTALIMGFYGPLKRKLDRWLNA